MRKSLIALVLLGGIATAPMPALAQGQPEIGKRVDKLEREMRAVQRKVFGTTQVLEPEIAPPTAPGAVPGTPATTPLNDLTARVDALEAQLTALTGQVEQAVHKTNQLEKEFARIQAIETRLKALESAPPPAAAPAVGGEEAAAAPDPERAARVAAVQRPSTGDEAEDAYIYGYRLWEAKLYPEAQAVLKQVAEKWPEHRRASYAQNLLGRAYLDEGKPALASVAFYDNYQKMPKGERAPDSLFYLGQALVQLKKAPDACKVYDELEDVYGATLSASLKSQVADARKKAKCA